MKIYEDDRRKFFLDVKILIYKKKEKTKTKKILLKNN